MLPSGDNESPPNSPAPQKKRFPKGHWNHNQGGHCKLPPSCKRFASGHPGRLCKIYKWATCALHADASEFEADMACGFCQTRWPNSHCMEQWTAMPVAKLIQKLTENL